MTKELMIERLRKIENLEQRQLLKDIVSGVFVNLIDYQDEMNKKLEERVFNEMDDFENMHDIYVTLSSRENIDPIHECLFPMLRSDLEDQPIHMDKLLEPLKNNQPSVLFTLFLECDAMQIQQLLAEQRQFTGKILTSEGQVHVKVMLQKNVTYLQEVEKLHSIFQMNGVPWKTINHPYIHKFFDVLLVECPPLREETEILEFVIDLEEYEDKKRLNMVPLWNIERIELKNIGFPTPALDKVNYEHVLSIRKTGAQHGYLVDGCEGDIRYIKRGENELTIVSPHDKSGVWQLLKIAKREEEKIGRLEYELVSNRRKNHFTHKFANKYTPAVKTKGEIIRLINSFEVAEKVELVTIDVLETFNGESVSYSVNPFFIEELGEHSNKNVMLLTFKAKEHMNFMLNDILSFLVSEVQRYFIEYKCVGAWL